MGGSTSRISQENIVNMTSELVTRAIQTATFRGYSTQEINQDCTDFVQTATQAYLSCVESVRDRPAEEIINICQAIQELGRCETSNVILDSTVNIDNSAVQDMQITQEMQNSISNELTSRLNQQTGFRIGDEAENEIRNVVNESSKIVTDNRNDIFNDIGSNQSITNKGGTVRLVTFKNAQNVVSKTLQSNTSFQDSVSNLTNTLDSELSQSGGGIGNILMIVIGVLLVIALLIWVGRAMFRSSQDTGEYNGGRGRGRNGGYRRRWGGGRRSDAEWGEDPNGGGSKWVWLLALLVVVGAIVGIVFGVRAAKK